MKERLLFVKAIETLLYSWGGDTPPEAIWGCNELLDWYEKEYQVKFKMRFAELDEIEDSGEHNEKVVKKLIKGGLKK